MGGEAGFGPRERVESRAALFASEGLATVTPLRIPTRIGPAEDHASFPRLAAVCPKPRLLTNGLLVDTFLYGYFIVVLIYHAISVVLSSVYAFLRWHGMKEERYTSQPEQPPLVTIVVPARNEEQNIGPCLEAILAQDYANLEVIVLDDASEDRTRTIAERVAGSDARVRILPGEPRPDDWFGKPWALHVAQRHARGEYLLFVDADVRLAPENLKHAMGYVLEQRADMLSLMGTLVVDGFWEAVVQPIMGYVIVAFFPLDRVNSPRSSITMCNGQYILIRRATYDAVGGHETIRNAILEDVALARTVKGAGHRYRFLMAPKEFSCRMYSTLDQIWEGWSKNFFAALQFKLVVAVIAGFLLVGLSLYPILDVLARLALGDTGHWLFPWSLAAAGSIFFLRLWVSVLFRFPIAHTLTHPLGVLIVFGIMLNSVLRTLLGKSVSWKGRKYVLKR